MSMEKGIRRVSWFLIGSVGFIWFGSALVGGCTVTRSLDESETLRTGVLAPDVALAISIAVQAHMGDRHGGEALDAFRKSVYQLDFEQDGDFVEVNIYDGSRYSFGGSGSYLVRTSDFAIVDERQGR